MDIPVIEKKILDHKFKKTTKPYDFDSFNDLCRALDITPVKSKGQRDALEVQFKRFFDYEKLPGMNKIKITGTHYSKPLPYITKRTGVHWTQLNKSIACLLMINDSLIGEELTKYAILKRIGLMRIEPAKKPSWWSHRNTYNEYLKKMYEGLDSAMTQLSKQGYMAFKESYYAIKKSKSIKLSQKQIDDYKAVYADVLREFGVNNSWAATYTNQDAKVISELNAQLDKKLGFSDVSKKILIAAGKKYNLDKFKLTYPGIASIPTREIKQHIIAISEESFWDTIKSKISDKHAKAIGCVSKKAYQDDIELIKKSK